MSSGTWAGIRFSRPPANILYRFMPKISIITAVMMPSRRCTCPTSQADLTRKEYPAHMRDDAVKQMIGMRAKFQNYKSYANAGMDQLFTSGQLEGALVLKAGNLSSGYCRNDGGGKFTLVPLPFMAQLSALNGMIADDFDGDGNLDLAMNTNDYGTDVTVGRYDALNGLMLKGERQREILRRCRSSKAGFLFPAMERPW
jgi:hypothetical protein